MVFVREGFKFSAFALGPFWFAWNRAWLGVFGWLIGVVSIIAVCVALGLGGEIALGAVFAFMLLMGLEASEFRLRSLLRRSYRLADVVEAQNVNEAEIRYLARHLSRRAPGVSANLPARMTPQRAEPVGLFLNGT